MAETWTPPPPPAGPPRRRPSLDVFDRLDAVRAFLDRQPVWATHVEIADVRRVLNGGE